MTKIYMIISKLLGITEIGSHIPIFVLEKGDSGTSGGRGLSCSTPGRASRSAVLRVYSQPWWSCLKCTSIRLYSVWLASSTELSEWKVTRFTRLLRRSARTGKA